MRRPGRVLALVVAVLLAVAGCTTDGTPSAVAIEPPHRLTAEQAGQLAQIRFVNYTTGTRGVRVQLPAATDQPALDVVGYYDFTQHLGYAKVDQIQDEVRSVLGLVSWTPATIGVADATRDDLPLPIPDEATPLTPLDPTTSTLNTMLAVITNLGADQPENADLLEQSDALWLRSELLNGVPVAVYAGPSADAETGVASSPAESATSPTTASPADPSAVPAPADDQPLEYWVTSAGELRRVQKVVDLGGGTTGVAVIDFLSADGVSLVEPTGTGTTGASTGAVPTDAVPTEEPSTDAATGTAPTEELPTEELPTGELPTGELPTGVLPPEEAFPGGQPTDPRFGDALPPDAFSPEEPPLDQPTDQEGPG
ncbi:hypothetical protein GCM10009818_33490 [Nakamurella flavida]